MSTKRKKEKMMATGTKKKRDYSEEWVVEGPYNKYEFQVLFNKRDPADSDDAADGPDFGYHDDDESYVSCSKADVYGCCGISTLEEFSWEFPSTTAGLEKWAKDVATQRFVKWVEECGENFICHTVPGFEPIEEMLKEAGFKQTAKFKNHNAHHGAEITQWNYTHDKYKVRTKKPSSVKPRSPSVRGRPATR